jgi:hypothetical protein
MPSLNSDAHFSLQEPLLSKLFLTAAVRRHTRALHHMCSMPKVMQCLDAATLQNVAQRLMAAGNISTMMVVLESFQDSAVQQLSSTAAAQLLQAAVALNSSTATAVLCGLAAAQRISSEVLLQLLLEAFRTGIAACADQLLGLPAAMQLPAGGVAQLLAAAVLHKPIVSKNTLEHDDDDDSDGALASINVRLANENE